MQRVFWKLRKGVHLPLSNLKSLYLKSFSWLSFILTDHCHVY